MNAPQGSEAWRMERFGWVTASQFSSVLAKGQGKMRSAYMRRLLAERLIGKYIETYHNAQMDRGIEQEPFGRMAYEAATGVIVQEVGFIPHPTMKAGGSPDGLIDTDGGLEIKSVLPTVQVETIMAGGYPSEHRSQIQGYMWVCGRAWWDFVSFCPDMPEHLQLYVFRVERDDAYIKTLESEVAVFLHDLETTYNALMRREHA